MFSLIRVIFIKIVNILDRIMQAGSFLAGCLIILMMLTVTGEVIARSIFERSQIWVIELVEYSLLYTTFLGTAWLLKKDGHVKMDFVYDRLKPRQKALIDIITSIMGVIICFVITWFGVDVTWFNFSTGTNMSTRLETPAFLVFMVIPFGSALLIVQFIRRIFKFWHIFKESSQTGEFTSKA